MFTRMHLAGLAIAVTIGIPEVAQAQYGFDMVPDTVFFSGNWAPYGTEGVPRSTTISSGLPNGYGFDRVPLGSHPHAALRRQQRFLKSVQQLTAAREQEDGTSKAKPIAKQATPKQAPAK